MELQQQDGGFHLSDDRRDKDFINVMKNRLSKITITSKVGQDGTQTGTHNIFELPNYRRLTRPGGLTHKDENIFDILLSRLESDEHEKIYTYFVKQIFDKTKYKQKFSKTEHGEPFLKSKSIYPYVKNFMGIICLSFILELELYSLTHLIITPNFFDNNRQENDKVVYGNLVQTVFYSKKREQEYRRYLNKFRIYRNFLSEYNLQNRPPSLDQIIEEFSKRIDIVFTKFMNLFIKNLSVLLNTEYDVIKNLIVPEQHYDHGPTRDPEGVDARLDDVRVDDYDHIFVDWKERIVKKFDAKIKKKDINKIFKETMDEYENNKTKYIMEGTGFFSFVFLKFLDPDFKKRPSLYKEQVHSGSCITYSLMEAYFMTKLHFNASHINLLLVTNTNYPRVTLWEYCRESLNLPEKKLNFSHWAMRLKFKTSDHIDFRVNKTNHKVTSEINFVKKRSEFVRLMLFPILDSYKNYLKLDNSELTVTIDDYKGTTLEKDIPADIKALYYGKIHGFIRRRADLIDRLMRKYGKDFTEESMLSGISRRKFTIKKNKKKSLIKKKRTKKSQK